MHLFNNCFTSKYPARIFASIFLAWIFSSWAAADVSSSRPDGHAPIAVMGEHTHKAGEWMLSYRYMTMFMDGSQSGTSDISNAQVLQQFMVTPTRMKMEMHMAGVMWAPSNRVTLMGMVPQIRNSMDHVNRMGRTFNTETRGVGDIKTTALVVLCKGHHHQLHFNGSLSFPTGSIDERDDTLMPDQPLPYPMQLGSGTYDLHPGLTYLGQTENWSWGSQAITVTRLGENDRDYTLGNRIQASLWGARKWTEWISSSLRFSGESWGDIEGADTALNPAMVPTADPKRRAGDRIDIHLGGNFTVPRGPLKGHRLALEVGIPVYQRLDGPQLETDYVTTIGWQKAF